MTDLERRLPRAVRPLEDPPDPGSGDPEHADWPTELERAAAAVLVPIVNRAGKCSILLTRRTDHLAKHAGQVSFPGGRAEEKIADGVGHGGKIGER